MNYREKLNLRQKEKPDLGESVAILYSNVTANLAGEMLFDQRKT